MSSRFVKFNDKLLIDETKIVKITDMCPDETGNRCVEIYTPLLSTTYSYDYTDSNPIVFKEGEPAYAFTVNRYFNNSVEGFVRVDESTVVAEKAIIKIAKQTIIGRYLNPVILIQLYLIDINDNCCLQVNQHNISSELTSYLESVNMKLQ